MNNRILLVVAVVALVALLAAVPTAFVLGSRAKAPPAAAQPAVAAPPAAAQPGPPPVRAVAARDQEPPPASEPAAEAKPAERPEAKPAERKGGLLGGLFAAAADDVKASGEQLAGDLAKQGQQIVSGAADELANSLTARIDAAAKDLERRSSDVVATIDGDLAKGGKRSDRQAGDQQETAKSTADAFAKQQAEIAESVQGVAAGFRKQLAAATADLATRVSDYNEALKQSTASATATFKGLKAALHGDAKSVAANLDVEKDAAAIRAAIDGFGKQAAELQRGCEDEVARLDKEVAADRDRLLAQMEEDRKAAQKRIDGLRAQLNERIAKAASDARRPLEEAQARLKTAHAAR